MTRVRPFHFVLGALEWNQAEICSILTMQLSRAARGILDQMEIHLSRNCALNE